MRIHPWFRVGLAIVVVLLAVGSWSPAVGERPRLAEREFFLPELILPTASVPLLDLKDRIPNAADWEKFLGWQTSPAFVYLDPVSGAPSGIITSLPLLPNTGHNNAVTNESLSSRLGRPVDRIDADVLSELIRDFVVENQGILRVSPRQLGPMQVAKITDSLWQVSAPQVVDGVPVRYARFLASINHGNLVTVGTESWGEVRLNTKARIGAEDAVRRVFDSIGGRLGADVVLREPALEIVPHMPSDYSASKSGGKEPRGYGHHLVWSFAFERPGEDGLWEALVDAHDGELISLRDIIYRTSRRIKGGVYPSTNTDLCPTATTCGTMQPDYPMPWADYRQSPLTYADGAGKFDYIGTATTTLNGRYVRVDPGLCGTLSVSSNSGDVNLGSPPSQHDCPAGGNGNSAAARTVFYEVGKITEMARGWLPNNTWLAGAGAGCNRTPIRVAVNKIAFTYCGGGYQPASTPSTVNFQSPKQCSDSNGQPVVGGVCRNTGEIATIIDHEWAHALDENDLGCTGSLSNTSEAYADIAAMYRHETSCFGYGRLTDNPALLQCAPTTDPCPTQSQTADGTGFNTRQMLTGHCAANCSGYRDADYAQHDHDPNTPDTALNFVCSECPVGPGPCGKETHCSAMPVTQAAWDLVTRDLRFAALQLRFHHGVQHRQQVVLPRQPQRGELVCLHLRCYVAWM